MRISSGNEHRLAHARASEQSDLAALGIGADQIDDLQAGLENFGCGDLFLERGRIPVDGKPLVDIDRAALVDGLPEQIENPAQGFPADRHGDRAAGVYGVGPAHKAVGRLHRHASHGVVAYHLSHFRGEGLPLHVRDMYGVQNLRQFGGWKSQVDNRSDYLNNFSCSQVNLRRVIDNYNYLSASAPPTISVISFVIAAWRALL